MSTVLSVENQVSEQTEEQFYPAIMEGLRNPQEIVDIHSALAFFERKTQLENSEGKHWVYLGHCYFISQDLERCYAIYQKCLYSLKEDTNPQLWYGIGLLYSKYNNWKYAEVAFLAALKISPDFEEKGIIYSNLAKIYKNQGHYENAEHYYKKAYELSASDLKLKAELLCNIGYCLELQNKNQEAVKVYKEVIKYQKNQEILGSLARLYEKLGDAESASCCHKEFNSEKIACAFNTKGIPNDIAQPIPQCYNPYMSSQHIYALYCLQLSKNCLSFS
ncbi:unnamed protein product [Blepharisma stoltei]|uniref:Tetratricopeptide repeat protein n=1 Tax=Blepharisma stoltei TaxID=1481888 RepID=A0AAU9K2S0_9CILI|nr:unnamed protein product [Blepharisma stoltei]